TSAADAINSGETKRGLIADDRPEEFHIFTGKQGDRISLTLTSGSSSKLAAVVAIRDAQTGVTLVQSGAGNSDSAVITDYALPYSGTFVAVATRYFGASGRTTGNYSITLTIAPDASPVKGELRPGQKVIGRLSDEEPSDRWTFTGKKDQVIGITSK